MTIPQLILVVFTLSFLLIAHELGHYLLARLFGVRVLEFSVGFGPLLVKTTRKRIQYSLRAVPFGAYVKLHGMELILEGEGPPADADDPASLRNQPAWKKALIVLAGPVNNLILTAITFVVAFAAIGVPNDVDRRSIVAFVDPKTPGYEAGLTAGDRVVALNGQPIKLWTELAEGIRASKGNQVTLTIDRAGRTLTRTVTPFYDPESKLYRIGIWPRYRFKRLGLGQSLELGVKSVYWTGVGLVQILARALRGRARAPLSGPIGAIGALGQSIQAGPWWFLQLVAALNLGLALFNLLPIPLPLLDGGWVVIYLFEGARRREFTAEQKAAAQLFGLVILATFFIFITYGDLLTGVRRFLNR